MDVMADALASGRRFRTLNIVDEYTREAPAIEVDTSLPGARVVRVLDELKQQGRKPEWIVPTTARSSPGRRWTSGRLRTACGWNRSVRDGRWTTATSRVSTVRCARNA
jgi:hypothetical protein